MSKHGGILNYDMLGPFNLYAKRKKMSRYDKPDKDLLVKIVKEILDEVAYQMVHSKGGVFIKNFGYFFVWKTTKKAMFNKYGVIHRKDVDGYFNHHTGQYIYKPAFITAGGPINLNFWSMDNKFSTYVKDGINKQLRAGHKYKTYMHSLKKLLNLPV